jgi:hypothetical protein
MNVNPNNNNSTLHSDLVRKTFVTNYLATLKERTRSEKTGIVFGFDWVMYNLGIALGWQPIRLPFLRNPTAEAAQNKTEAEFGVDLAFITTNGEKLTIFALKDESLTYKHWTANNFDIDLRRAASPDLTKPEFSNVKSVTIILAYNKDEDARGLESYTLCVASLGTRVADHVKLSFERWNLSKISDMIQCHLLSPELLPQHLTGLFTYICSQFSDFEYGTEEWDRQLVPNWKRFLSEISKGRVAESVIRLVPVALVILEKHRPATPYSRIGWQDLVEWSMLRLWHLYPKLKASGRKAVCEAWVSFFLAQLESLLIDCSPALFAEHGIGTHKASATLNSLNDSLATYWQLERVGLFLLASLEFSNTNEPEAIEFKKKLIHHTHAWISSAIKLQPAAFRPLIDLHHIPIFLIWYVLKQANDFQGIADLLSGLKGRLMIRRLRKDTLPFIEGGNRLELISETVATGVKPPEYVDTSSFLVSMLMELCFSLDTGTRDQLLKLYKQDIIEGMCNDGGPADVERLHLIDWIPPSDWSKRVLAESVHDGIGVSDPYCIDMSGMSIAAEIEHYVQEVNSKHPFSAESKISCAALILACIKNKCPLPPFFWRSLLFPDAYAKQPPETSKPSHSRKRPTAKAKPVSTKKRKTV